MTEPTSGPTTAAEPFDVLPEWAGADDDVFLGPSQAPPAKSRLRQALEWGAVVVGALLAALLIKTFLFQAFYIPSESMVPTLEKGDRVLVNKLAYDFGEIERGDIVVFRKPPGAPSSNVDDFIKRVVGLPGDTIEARDGTVFVNGIRLDEDYLDASTRTDRLRVTEIGEGQIFVMGDNRENSADSRVFGPIDVDLIVGEAFLRVWPPSRMGGL